MALTTKGVRVTGWLALLGGILAAYDDLVGGLSAPPPNFLGILAVLTPGLLLLGLANWLEKKRGESAS